MGIRADVFDSKLCEFEQHGKYRMTVRVVDFSTPEWRARLMDWAVGQEWFKEFAYWTQDRVEKIELAAIYVYLWRNLATLVVEYHGEGRE